MSAAARSIFFFGLYMVTAGLVFLSRAPATLRHGNPAAPFEPVHLLGILTLTVGCYYVAAARTELTPFFRFSVWGRALAFSLMLALVVSGTAPPQLLVVGLGDLAGAAWTHYHLKPRR